MKILITGSINYTNTLTLKSILHRIKEKYGTSDIIIASRDGTNGIDKSVKRIALEFSFEYGIFNIYHHKHTPFSIIPYWKFNKNYNPRHYFWRDNDAVKWADLIIIFCAKNNYDEIKNIIMYSSKLNKRVCIVN